MTNLALVTCQAHPHLTGDDRLLLKPLLAAGVRPSIVSWDAAQVEWERFDGVLVRSPWDYFERIDAFHEWLARLVQAEVQVWNPVPIMRSNTDKNYLRNLEAGGVTIPLTHWIERGAEVDLAALKALGGLERYVVKPTISGGAAETWVSGTQTAPEEQAALERILQRSGAMLQSYLPEIESQGEWSLMFFGGEFSHAIKKLPAGGDFRVQTEHGGSVQSLPAPAALIEEAEDILRGLRKDLLYARVDGLEIAGEFTLLELELVEPELFFRCDPGAPQRFVEALLELRQPGGVH